MYKFEKSVNKMGGVYIVFDASPMVESEKTFGISHLIEHMVTDSLKSLEREYDEMCIEQNAFTGKEEIVFYITGLSSCIEKHKYEFVKRITEYVPLEEHFKKQIGIVKQEYNDWYNDANCNAWGNYLSSQRGYVFQIGTGTALDNLTFQDVLDFFTVYVKPVSIYEVGENPSSFGVAMVEKKPRALTPGYFCPQIAQVNTESLPMLYGFSERDIKENEYLSVIVRKMLSYGLGSPLYRIREDQHLVYWVGMSDIRYGDKVTTLISTSGKKTDKINIQFAIEKTVEEYHKNMTLDRYNTIMENTRNRIEINRQENYKWSWLSYEVEGANIRDNIDKVSYDGVMQFFRDNYLNSLESFFGFDDLIF